MRVTVGVTELATLKFPRFVLNELEGKAYFFTGQVCFLG